MDTVYGISTSMPIGAKHVGKGGVWFHAAVFGCGHDALIALINILGFTHHSVFGFPLLHFWITAGRLFGRPAPEAWYGNCKGELLIQRAVEQLGGVLGLERH